MSQQQPQLYQSLTAALTPEEQAVIKAAVENADRIAAEQVARQAAGGGEVPGTAMAANGQAR